MLVPSYQIVMVEVILGTAKYENLDLRFFALPGAVTSDSRRRVALAAVSGIYVSAMPFGRYVSQSSISTFRTPLLNRRKGKLKRRTWTVVGHSPEPAAMPINDGATDG